MSGPAGGMDYRSGSGMIRLRRTGSPRGLGLGVAFGAAFAVPGDSIESEGVGGLLERVEDGLVGVFGGVLGDAGPGGDGAHDEVGALEYEGYVVGVIGDDVIELEAEEGDLGVEAADNLSVGQPLFVGAGHPGGIEGVLGLGRRVHIGNPFVSGAYPEYRQYGHEYRTYALSQSRGKCHSPRRAYGPIPFHAGGDAPPDPAGIS